MEAKIQKQIIDYFVFFEEFYNSSKTCLKNCQNCSLVINKLIIRSRKIKLATLTGTPLEEFAELQSKLFASLHNLISEEIHELRTYLSTIEDLFEKLCNKHKVLQQSCKDIDFTQQSPLIRGTPYQPQLKEILEFTEDSLSFGSEVCAQIDTTLSVLTLKGLDTESLTENFKFPSHWQERLSEIIAYTSFCSENQI